MILFLYLILNILKIKSIIVFKSSPHSYCLIFISSTKDSFSFSCEGQESSSVHFSSSPKLLTNQSFQSRILSDQFRARKRGGGGNASPPHAQLSTNPFSCGLTPSKICIRHHNTSQLCIFAIMKDGSFFKFSSQ